MKARKLRTVVIEIECQTAETVANLRKSSEVSMWDVHGNATLCACLTEQPRVNVIRIRAAKRRGGKGKR